MDAEITEEAREAYRANRKWPPETYPGILAIALRDQLAARRRAEFQLHIDECTDEEHLKLKDWIFAKWQEAADKELRGESA